MCLVCPETFGLKFLVSFFVSVSDPDSPNFNFLVSFLYPFLKILDFLVSFRYPETYFRLFPTWNVPNTTHRYLVEVISMCTHPKVMLASCYFTFSQSFLLS